MPRKKKPPEPAAERGTPNTLPSSSLGRFKCPSCSRVFNIENRDDLKTAKEHLQNRDHGQADELERVDEKAQREEERVGEESEQEEERATA